MEATALAAMLSGSAVRLLDLTHAMTPEMPVWPTHRCFTQDLVESYDRGDGACNHAIRMSEHSGTHIDAPFHFVRGGSAVDAIDPRRRPT